MNDQHTLANLMEAMSENLIFNLDFLPEDKFDWNPAPTANSALEITNHILGLFHGFAPTSGAQPEQFSPATGAEEAKKRLRESYTTFIAWLRKASPEELDRTILFFGTETPLRILASMALIDTINHHGQVTYIQTLLGDTQSHFRDDLMAFLS